MNGYVRRDKADVRRRPGIAALENVFRGLMGQRRLVRHTPQRYTRFAYDAVTVSDRAAVTIRPEGIPSAGAFGTPTVIRKSGGAAMQLRGGGTARASDLGDTPAINERPRQAGRPGRIAEVTFILTTTGFSGWLGEQTTGGANGAFVFASLGCLAGYAMWTRWAEPPGS